MTSTLGRVDQYEWTLWIDNRYCGVWDDNSGGAVTAAETKFRPGGMGPQVSLGGQSTVSNVMLTKAYDRQTMADEQDFIINRVGKGRCVAHRQPLDADGNAFGRVKIYQGVLNSWTPADAKATSNDVDTYAIDISTDGVVG